MNFRVCLILCWISVLSAWGRGGGGCLEQGTLIRTPGGQIAIERLKAGDAVLTFRAGALHPATVQALLEVQPVEYLAIDVAGRTLHATAEHPFQVAPGVFQTADSLQPGDILWLGESNALAPVILDAVRRLPAQKPAYNLLVSPGGTYFANEILVHNKGCFLPDTPVLRADGSTTPISAVQPGERLLAFTTTGQIVTGTVQTVLTHRVDEYRIVTTDAVQLRVTPEHPFYVGLGTFKTLESLRLGDTIYAHDGQRALTPQRIIGLQSVHASVLVYNLQTDAPHTYFASGIAVHNKGGCFPAGTLVTTPGGDRPIETLAPGDLVVAIDDAGRAVQTRVQARYETVAARFTLTTDTGRLVTTAEHPLRGTDGQFREAASFRPGDLLSTWHRGRLHATAVRTVESASDLVTVYNLRVGEPHTFVADGYVVHNKGGGCFPAGTGIQTPTGSMPIEQLQPGAAITAVDSRGQLIPSKVRTLFIRQAPLLRIDTTLGQLQTTAEHPVRLRDSTFCEAADLQPGDHISHTQDGNLKSAQVTQVQFLPTSVTVYNLEADEPHTFIAGGFVVHNKGGGFGGSRSRSSGGYRSGGGSSNLTAAESEMVGKIMFGIFGFIVLCMIANGAINRLGKPKEEEDLDFVFDANAVSQKAGKTRKLLEFIARVDADFLPATLESQARDTFLKLQECWQAREYSSMEPLLMQDLYRQHLQQIKGLIRHHEINIIGDLKLLRLDLVHVRYTHKKNTREFTALITASSRDHYIDDRTREFLRGDDEPATFQEFWTFQRSDDRWLLREIEQTRESDALKDENFFEQFTDQGVQQIYDNQAGKEGPIGPWLEQGTEGKASRTERLLNFLVTTDKLWNRTDMLELARATFVDVKLAWEAMSVSPALAEKLFPNVVADLRAQIARRQERNDSFEYRNLCVRKVELLIVRNFADNGTDEFTVRIHAHAQQTIRRSGTLVSQQPYVTPFEEYWTFGRLDNQWKLKELLPPAHGKKLVDQENVDEESSPEQLQWFYSQSRPG
jgi:predicted lipid-binding transport protein (Tim44 family)